MLIILNSLIQTLKYTVYIVVDSYCRIAADLKIGLQKCQTQKCSNICVKIVLNGNFFPLLYLSVEAGAASKCMLRNTAYQLLQYVVCTTIGSEKTAFVTTESPSFICG